MIAFFNALRPKWGAAPVPKTCPVSKELADRVRRLEERMNLQEARGPRPLYGLHLPVGPLLLSPLIPMIGYHFFIKTSHLKCEDEGDRARSCERYAATSDQL